MVNSRAACVEATDDCVAGSYPLDSSSVAGPEDAGSLVQQQREAVDSDSMSVAITDTKGSGNGIANLESADSQLKQEREQTVCVEVTELSTNKQHTLSLSVWCWLAVETGELGSQVPRRSTVASVDDGSLGGLQRQEIWKGKSHQSELFGGILPLWSLLLCLQGCARMSSVFSRVPFSFLSPFPQSLD